MANRTDPSVDRQPTCRRCGSPLSTYRYETNGREIFAEIGCLLCEYHYKDDAAECEIAALN